MRLIFQAVRSGLFRVESTTVILLQSYLFKRVILMSLIDESHDKK